MNNYRGISILPPIAKIFEKILAEQIRIYFEINNLLYFGQHGFRAGHSCETALNQVLSNCFKNLDAKSINLLLFIDFSKAFDMIKLSLLLVKLLNYGFSNSAIRFLECYFSTRLQSVKLGKTLSDTANINLGVPQGSILGPLLFLIYINDLPQFLQLNNVVLFADDKTLLFDDNSLDSVIKKFNFFSQRLID